MSTSLLLRLLLLLVPAVAAAQTLSSPTEIGSTAGFTPNRGQVVDVDRRARPEIRFTSFAKGMRLYLGSNRISYVFSAVTGDLARYRHSDGRHGADSPSPIVKLHRIDLEFIGASTSPVITEDLPLGSYTNYYLAHAPEGLTFLPSYGRITYHDLYPNIDFVMTSSRGSLKYDFVVRPGGKVSDIRMRYVGATGTRLDRSGRLITSTPLGTLEEEEPYTFQEEAGGAGEPSAQRRIPSGYRLEKGVISFSVAHYDRARTLVIDPTQKWSTYVGGATYEDINGGDVTEVDRSGNILMTGNTADAGFPTSVGAHSRTLAGREDIFVVKFNSAGEMLWGTFYGGSYSEICHGIVTDRLRNVFIAGHTESPDFPTLDGHANGYGGGNRDAVVVKFDSAGVRQWATYYGGADMDDGYGFAIDSSGNPALVGTTASTGGIATPGGFQTAFAGADFRYFDVFLVKFDAAGVRQWGTYIGGAELEQGYGAATDIDDNITITGWTASTDFPVTPGAFQPSLAGGTDAFVMRFDSRGARLWGTFFGGPGYENESPRVIGTFAAIATDGEGNPIITGFTSGGLPVTPGALQPAYAGGDADAFAAKFDTLGRQVWATYYGGTGIDAGQGVASNATNGVLVTGHTFSADLPAITADAFQPAKKGGSDAFILKLNSRGAGQYATYYGGDGADEGVGISFDPFGSIVVGGQASEAFPVTPDAAQATYAGSGDGFLALFCDIEGGVLDTSGSSVLCIGGSVTLFVPPGYTSYLWQSRSNSAISTSNQITVTEPGDYWVRLSNGAGCIAYTDTVEVRVRPAFKPATTPGGSLEICPDDSLDISAEEGHAAYQWRRDGVDIASERGRTLTVRAAGVYTVVVIDDNGCSGESEPVVVTIRPRPAAPTITASGNDMTSSPGIAYQWNLDGVPIPGATGQSYNATTNGFYTVTVTDANGCRSTSEPYDPGNPAVATVGIYNYSGKPGETVTIPITLLRSQNLLVNRVGGFTARIRFNSSLLFPTSPVQTSVVDGNDRVITVSGTLPAGYAGDSISLAFIDFRVMLGDTTATPLLIETFVWDRGSVATSTFNGLFRLQGLCENGGTRLVDASGATTLKPAHPNPTGGATSIEYEVVEDGRTQLLLVDQLGRTIPIVDATIEAGRYVATFDVSDLPAGTWYYILQTRTERIARTLSIQR